MEKTVCTNDNFCHLVWKLMPLQNFKELWIGFLVIFTFANCYINDVIIFSLTLKNHMHHFQKVFNLF
jgi:hypothetical protein